MSNNIDIYNLRSRLKTYLSNHDQDLFDVDSPTAYRLGAEQVLEGLTYITGIDFDDLTFFVKSLV